MNLAKTPKFALFTALLTAGLALYALSLAPAPATALQADANGAGGQTLGVVDVERIVSESQLRKSLDERVAAIQSQFQSDIEAAQAQRTQLTQQLSEVGSDASRAQTLRRDIQLNRARIEALQQAAQQEIAQLIQSTNLTLARSMSEAATQVAQERGLSMVIRKSPQLPATFAPRNQQEADAIAEAVSRQVVLYTPPGADITSEVVSKMNAALTAGGGGTGGN